MEADDGIDFSALTEASDMLWEMSKRMFPVLKKMLLIAITKGQFVVSSFESKEPHELAEFLLHRNGLTGLTFFCRRTMSWLKSQQCI